MEQEESVDPQLWQACAGPMVQIPPVNSKVFYFAQGHAEHAHAPPFHAPVPPLILCSVVAVKFYAERTTGEVYTKITLLPLPGNDLDLEKDGVLGRDGNGKPLYFVQKLKHAEVSGDGEFMLPMLAAKIFPGAENTKDVCTNSNLAQDIHGQTWRFDLIYRIRPRGYVMTIGWDKFVKDNKLIAGDSIIFLRSESGQLRVGFRRAKHDNVKEAAKISIESVLKAVARAARGHEFEVVYYPRAGTPEFCVKATNVRTANSISWCSGMRFKMAFEKMDYHVKEKKKDSFGVSWFKGTVSGVQVADPIRWPNSPWRLLQVVWDKDDFNSVEELKRINPWLVELVPKTRAINLSSSTPRKRQQTKGGDKVITTSGTTDSQDMTSEEQMDENKELPLTVAKPRGDAKRSRSIELSYGSSSSSRSIITNVAGTSTTTDLSIRNLSYPNDDWSSFSEFLGISQPSFNFPGCTAENIIDFLHTRQASGDAEALVGRLSAAYEEVCVKPQDNPFHSVAVTAYLRAAKEMTRETECILVFTCGDSNDVDETFFIETISKKLQEREVTPLTYNLSGRDKLDVKMLDRSSVGIMVISNSYSFSNQSLDHLMEILGHGKEENLVTLPIFFKVTLSDVCGLEGKFEAVYLQQPDKVQKWKAAMAAIVTMDVHEWKKETEVMLAEEVVRNACLRLYLKSSKNLVRILALLNGIHPLDAHIVGIWGMAGIGKTSIAREIFGILAPQYDLCYFLQDFDLMCQKKGLRQMRDDFYSSVFGEEKSIGASDVKPSFMKDWFYKKSILVVLDDVSNARDVEGVVGGFSWFSCGHRIILTSRIKQVLIQCKVKELYEIRKLCEFESFRLCKHYLNRESCVIPELMRCSSGIPLALNVLGSSLSKQHTDNMKIHLHGLRRNPPTKIQEAFRRSFDGLDENEMNIFLDLVCFFIGENKDHVVQLLDACGFLTYLGICDLIDASLISLLDNRIEIPIPFQDMGRFIVQEEDEDPCERSRLWESSDIVDVLTNNSGTEATEGIFLDASDLKCELSPAVFDNMHKLRLLKFYCSTSGNECKLNLPQGLHLLPDELRLLYWENYPLKSLPQKFNPENLVELDMPYSNMEKLWEEKKNLEKLRKINLSHSRNLTDILTFSAAPNLEHIDLEGCTSLVDVSTSIPRNGKLVSLNMKDCSHLRSLPALVDLTSLKLLNLSGCSELEEVHDIAPNLKEIYLAGTAITELPLSFENLTELVTLDLENCKSLQQLPFGIKNSRSIVELKLSGCTSLELGKRKRSV